MHSEFEVSVGFTQFDFDGAIEGKLEGVRDEIENDLFPHVTIDVGRLGQRRTVDIEAQAGLLDGRAKDTREFRRKS